MKFLRLDLVLLMIVGPIEDRAQHLILMLTQVTIGLCDIFRVIDTRNQRFDFELVFKY